MEHPGNRAKEVVPHVKREGVGEEAFHRGPIWPNETEMMGAGPSRWELTPWSLSTVQMSGRAFLSTSWTSKAWKPAARKQGLHGTTRDAGRAAHPPLRRSLAGSSSRDGGSTWEDSSSLSPGRVTGAAQHEPGQLSLSL